MRFLPAFVAGCTVFLIAGCSRPEKDREKVTGSARKAHATGVTVAVVGDTAGNEALKREGGELIAGDRLAQSDVVLVAVSCRQSVLDSTLDALDRVAGQKVNRLAILLTEVSRSAEEDVLQLVEMETRMVLGPVVGGKREAGWLPLLRTDDAELGQKIKKLSEQNANPTKLGKPDREEWKAYTNKFRR